MTRTISRVNVLAVSRAPIAPPAAAPTTSSAEAGYIAPLPERLDSGAVVMISDERNSILARHAVEHGQARERRARSPKAAGARDLNALTGGTPPCLGERAHRLITVGWQAEVTPAQPPRFPRDRRRFGA